MAVVQSGIFSNPSTGFSTSSRKTNQDLNGPRGGISDADFKFVNGKPTGESSIISPDPSSQRLEQAQLAPGGGMNLLGGDINTAVPGALADRNGGDGVNIVSFGPGGEASETESSPAGSTSDWRVRVSVAANAKVLYRSGNDIMFPLMTTDGVIFPYVPMLQLTHSARYNSMSPSHSNYTNFFYQNSAVEAIGIQGDFSAQTPAEADYVLAVIYFFRAATKMFFGDSGVYQGSPPPIVYLDGYGKHYLPHVPCLVTNFSHSMPNDVDYLLTSSSGQRVPTMSSINISLQPIYSRKRQLEFNFDKFAAGQQLDKGFL